MCYTRDLFTGKWIVLVGDIIVRHFDTETECVAYIDEHKK